MTDILPFLKELITSPGISGREDPTARMIETAWQPLVDEFHTSPLGSLHGLHKGTSPSPRHSVLVAAHMDAIGLLVTGLENEFIRFTSVGGIDARILPGQPVLIFASGGVEEEILPGWIIQPPAGLLSSPYQSSTVPLEHLFIDIGLSEAILHAKVRVGDVISFAQPPLELKGDTLAGHSIDNRASVAALTICLQELQSKTHAWDLWAVCTTQEETGYLGSLTSAFQIRPSLAVVVDTTWAKGPGSEDWNTFPLSKGITLMWGPNFHPKLHKILKDLADKLEIPNASEITGAGSGTDAFAIQVVAEGIPVIAIGIPIRYMHTPVEVVSLKDIRRAGRLLAEFISALTDEIFDNLSLEK